MEEGLIVDSVNIMRGGKNDFQGIVINPLSSRAKMKNGEYESVEQIDADLSLMFENAKRYNMPNSSIYKRAFRLQQIMQVNTSAPFTVRLCC